MRENLILRSAPTVEPLTLAEAKLHLRQTQSFDDDLIRALIVAARQAAETITRRAIVAQKWSLLLDQFPRPGLNIGSANWYGPQWGINPGPMTVLSPDGFTGYEIFLPLPPMIAIEAITYMDSVTGTVQTLDPSQYLVVSSNQTSITPAYGTVWPQTQDQKAAVAVKFTAGYAAPITAADPTADTITAPLWSALVGDAVRLSNTDIGGELPEPLQLGVDYYVQSVVSPGVYKLSASSGGAAIDITNSGVGQSFVGVVPEGIKSWIKIRLGTLYENREEVAILNRGKMEVLPYVDNLLDPFRVLTF